MIDSQSARAAETVARAARGFDAGKRVNGTKRHIAIDVLGLLLTVLVTGAGVQHRDGALPLLERLRAACLRVALVWADGAYAGTLLCCRARNSRCACRSSNGPMTPQGSSPSPRRWVVERTLA